MSAKAWERLADEALADALEWKTRARDAELARFELLRGLQLIDANAAESVEWIRRVAREAIARSQVTT